jgi:alkanesulfonate monooxygenase SsuD/methylene tetrahydromethanopterin reductase-like flavin-dependent oxidoreductase (luciferase family)
VELDLLYEITVAKPWANGLREAERETFNGAIEQVKLADKVGFRTAWFVEHHFRAGRSHCSAPEVLIGALATVTENIRLGFGVTLMPHGFSHPVRVAERVATADVISGGRVEWGTGRSTPGEQAAFNVPLGDESRKQWADAIRAVTEMWRSDEFTWDSEYLKMPIPRPVLPKPFQDPHPPAWVAAVSEGSPAAAGKAGLGMLSFSILRSIESMAEHIRQYREAAKNPEPLTDVINNKVAAYTLVHCAETAEKAAANGAWDAVWWWYQNFAELTLEWDFPHFTEAERTALFPLLQEKAEGRFEPQEFSKEDMIIIGDVDDCIRKMKRYADAGADHLVCYVQFGHLSNEAILENIELLGTKVLPAIKDYQPNFDAFKYVPPSQESSSGVSDGLGVYETPNVALTPAGLSRAVQEED